MIQVCLINKEISSVCKYIVRASIDGYSNSGRDLKVASIVSCRYATPCIQLLCLQGKSIINYISIARKY